MKKTKLALALLLIATLLFTLVACGGGGDTENGYNGENGYEDPATLPGTIESGTTTGTVTVNGVSLPDATIFTAAGESAPTHVSLFPVMNALGVYEFEGDGAEEIYWLEGLNGQITFMFGANLIEVGDETVDLPHYPFEYNGVFYVPVLFFQDAFGAGSATVSGSEEGGWQVIINE